MSDGEEPVVDLGTEEIYESDQMLNSLLREAVRPHHPEYSGDDPVIMHPEDAEPAAVPEPDDVDSDEERVRETQLRKRTWRGTEDINRRYFATINKELPLQKIAFDTQMEFGQTRMLNEKHVLNLMDSLQ